MKGLLPGQDKETIKAFRVVSSHTASIQLCPAAMRAAKLTIAATMLSVTHQCVVVHGTASDGASNHVTWF
jgi:hypothetical protein